MCAAQFVLVMTVMRLMSGGLPCTIVVQFQATDIIVYVQSIQYGTMITETAHTFTWITILSDL